MFSTRCCFKLDCLQLSQTNFNEAECADKCSRSRQQTDISFLITESSSDPRFVTRTAMFLFSLPCAVNENVHQPRCFVRATDQQLNAHNWTARRYTDDVSAAFGRPCEERGGVKRAPQRLCTPLVRAHRHLSCLPDDTTTTTRISAHTA